MAALKFHVYDRASVTMDALRAGPRERFRDAERLRQMLLNRTPRYGNDDDYADDIMRRLFDAYFDAIDGRPNAKGARTGSIFFRRQCMFISDR